MVRTSPTAQPGATSDGLRPLEATGAPAFGAAGDRGTATHLAGERGLRVGASGATGEQATSVAGRVRDGHDLDGLPPAVPRGGASPTGVHLPRPEAIAHLAPGGSAPAGVGAALSASELAGRASAGNGFRTFGDAQAVARGLRQPLAIVERAGIFYLHHCPAATLERLSGGGGRRPGDNLGLDQSVVALVGGDRRVWYHWGYRAPSARVLPGSQVAYAQRGRIMVGGAEHRIAGLNVYDLADVGARSPAELERTLRAIADSGANTVRFWAFDRHDPALVRRVLDTSTRLGLGLRFIPVLGNHWQHCEGPGADMVKDEAWYREGYRRQYLPRALAMVEALADRPEILMWEVLNEPEASHAALRAFADDVSTRIRAIYRERERAAGRPLPHHLLSLGTLGGERRNGMRGHDFKDLFGLPNLDLVTAHDYGFDRGEAGADSVSPLFTTYARYAAELGKPFFVGEIGVKVRATGSERTPDTRPVRAPAAALDILRTRLTAYERLGIAGVLLWGPQPAGHGVDGDGYGFSFGAGDALAERLRSVMATMPARP